MMTFIFRKDKTLERLTKFNLVNKKYTSAKDRKTLILL